MLAVDIVFFGNNELTVAVAVAVAHFAALAPGMDFAAAHASFVDYIPAIAEIADFVVGPDLR